LVCFCDRLPLLVHLRLQPYGFGIAYSAIGALVVYQLLVSLTSRQRENAWLRLPALAMLLLPIIYIPSIYGGLKPVKVGGVPPINSRKIARLVRLAPHWCTCIPTYKFF
jgi:hypothetical protein